MSFRVILIENGSLLKCKLDNLIVNKNGEYISIPLNDISTIVVDNYTTSLTTRLLGVLNDFNISLVVCDDKHLPSGIYTGHNNHSRATKVLYKQISMGEDCKERVWQEIIRKKIENQLKVLIRYKAPSSVCDKLNNYYMNIGPGDRTNREGHAAKVYFNALMEKGFSRRDDTYLINSGLNYGYTIVRSYIARLAVGYGLNTMIGVHHRNEYNAFNLVDDLIEPMRPIIDIYVMGIMDKETVFSYGIRRQLIDFVNQKIIYQNKKQYVTNALNNYIAQFVSALDTYDFSKVEYPDVENYLEVL